MQKDKYGDPISPYDLSRTGGLRKKTFIEIIISGNKSKGAYDLSNRPRSIKVEIKER